MKQAALLAVLLLPLSALLASCRNTTLSAKTVPDWPLFAEKAIIQCRNGEPYFALIRGERYALNGKARVMDRTATFLDWNVPGMIKPHPNPDFADKGMKAYLTTFNAAAEKVCS